MQHLNENSVSVKINDFYRDNNSASEMSKDSKVKGDELLKYISTNLLSENNIDLRNVDDLQRQYKLTNIFKIDENTTIEDSILLYNEKFFVEKESDIIIISHPVWSLIGQGETLYEAIKEMTELAFEVFKSLVDENPSDLTIDANNLRDFLFKVF